MNGRPSYFHGFLQCLHENDLKYTKSTSFHFLRYIVSNHMISHIHVVLICNVVYVILITDTLSTGLVSYSVY